MIDAHLEAEIYYLTEKEGGRRSFVKSGYRGQFYYNGRDWDAPQEFIDKEICYPDETVTVKMQTLSPIFHVGQFWIGQEFEIREGAKTVGKGKITCILRNDFNYWNYTSFLLALPTRCRPYDIENLDGFITDFEYAFKKILEVQELKFTTDLLNLSCMIKVECVLNDNNGSARLLADKICTLWETELSFNNNSWKVSSTYYNTGWLFQLQFATYHSMYLTGNIVVDFKKY